MAQCPELQELAGPIYVREKGRLSLAGPGGSAAPPIRLFPRGFSVEPCVTEGDACERKEKPLISTAPGGPRSAKSLFTLTLELVAENIQHIDSLRGFPDQVAQRLFTAAEARSQFCCPRSGLRALRKFTEAYGALVLSSLCLRGRYLLVSEKLEQIRSFRGLRSLDLSCCKLGDDHELLGHLSSPAMDSLESLYLKDNCLSDIGLRRLTAPVRVLQRGLGKLTLLDLSCNPAVGQGGAAFLLGFTRLRFLDISGSGVEDPAITCQKIRARMGLVRATESLPQFAHEACRSRGWAEQLLQQWEQRAASALRPKEIPKPWLAALQFYGKEKGNHQDGDLPASRAPPAAAAPLLQFYRPEGATAAATDTGRHPVKRAKEEDKKDEASPPPVKKTRVALTSQDWDLLNSY